MSKRRTGGHFIGHPATRHHYLHSAWLASYSGLCKDAGWQPRVAKVANTSLIVSSDTFFCTPPLWSPKQVNVREVSWTLQGVRVRPNSGYVLRPSAILRRIRPNACILRQNSEAKLLQREKLVTQWDSFRIQKVLGNIVYSRHNLSEGSLAFFAFSITFKLFWW